MKIVLASNNPHKLVEISKITENFGFELVLQSELGVDIDVEETGTTWVADNLAKSVEVWVTQDSVSMVYEALSSGAPVGIIEMPAKEGPHKPDASRIARGLSMLIADGSVCRFTEWAKPNTIPRPGTVMKEAARAATYILDHFPKLLP